MENRSTKQGHAMKSSACGLNVLVIGHKNVGKTTLIDELCKIASSLSGERQNIEKGDNGGKKRTGESLVFLEANLFDKPSFRKLTIGIADAFLLTYAVDDEESFDYVTTLIRDVQLVMGQSVPIVVVGNKCEREVTMEKRIIADCVVTIDYECKHIETSARQGQGLKDVFSVLLGYFGPCLVFPNTDENDCKKKQSIGKRLTGMFRRLCH